MHKIIMGIKQLCIQTYFSKPREGKKISWDNIMALSIPLSPLPELLPSLLTKSTMLVFISVPINNYNKNT